MDNSGHPTGSIEIHVEMFEKELLFRLDDLYFDYLDATWFEKGNLEVRRQNTIFEQTQAIEWYGTHGACVCFIGLKKLGCYATNVLTPNMFETGDILRVEAPALTGTDFKAHLRDHYRSYRSMVEITQAESAMTVGEFQDRMASKLSDHPDREQRERVLRFNT